VTHWQAQIGDEVAVGSKRFHGGGRRGKIVEILGSPEREYYRVRWEDGRETLYYPGSDAVLVPSRPRKATPRAAAGPRPPAKARRTKKDQHVPEEKHGLRASAGDRLVIHGHRLGEPDRDGEILEALGENGGPPFRVLWSDTGREALVFPGPDAAVDHLKRRGKSAKQIR
jgi:hypothetical protein